MRLVQINGKILELSILWDDKYSDSEDCQMTLAEKNIRAIDGLGWHRGIVMVLAANAVKSKATAVIETTVNSLPHQMTYDIYHNSKGFFCKVQNQRVFLKDLISNTDQ